MKRITIILFLLLLTGCMSVPVKPKFPSVPKALTEPCTPLNKLDNNNVSIVDFHKVVVENYTLYHECSIKVESWNEWYKEQKKIYDEIK